MRILEEMQAAIVLHFQKSRKCTISSISFFGKYISFWFICPNYKGRDKKRLAALQSKLLVFLGEIALIYLGI